MLTQPKIIILLVPEYNKLSCSAVEIFLALLTNYTDGFIKTCMPVITESGVLYFPNREKFVDDLAGIGAKGVTRGLDYATHSEYVDNLVMTEQKNLVLPTRREDQLTALKNILGDKVVTCSLKYDSRMTMIMAEEYIKTAKFWNMHFIANRSVKELAEEIPQTFDYDTDYKFDLIDVYDKDKIASFLKQNFNQEFTEGKFLLWNEWVSKTSYWSKYENK